MLYLIGLGLNDENDISLKAVEALKGCDSVYAETYTSGWRGDFEALERLAGRPIRRVEREFVESLEIAKEALSRRVALLVPGDPLAATTHMELFLACKKAGAPVKVIHGSSVFTAIAETGLQLYKFGRTTTLAFPAPNFDPDSPYEAIAENRKAGLHSLVLLDVGPPRAMTVREALDILLRKEERLKRGAIGKDSMVVAAAEMGGEAEILYDTAERLARRDPKKVPAVLIIPGNLNFKEEEALELWKP